MTSINIMHSKSIYFPENCNYIFHYSWIELYCIYSFLNGITLVINLNIQIQENNKYSGFSNPLFKRNFHLSLVVFRWFKHLCYRSSVLIGVCFLNLLLFPRLWVCCEDFFWKVDKEVCFPMDWEESLHKKTS